jgi:tricorn protease
MHFGEVRKALMAALVIAFAVLPGAAAETRLLRYPDIHKDKIVFCYGGDIYTAFVTGENVKRLTSFPGEELLPKFSPDGERIAFTAEFEGGKDVYVMSAHGGKPTRLTYHPADEYMVDWTPDGTKIAFRSNGSSSSYRFNRLHVVPAQGGLPTVLELPEADLSSFDDTGDRIAFCRTNLDTARWKRYRGGLAPAIWTYDFKARKAEMVIDDPCGNRHPMWIGDDIYFVSDRGGSEEQNLWVYKGKSKDVHPLTFYKDWGVQWPSKGEDKIIYENEGRLAFYDLTDGKVHSIKLEIVPPPDAWAEQVKNVKANISGAPAPSPDGKKVIICARGELFLWEAEKKAMRNLTMTSGANERYPVWSPDGRRFAYVSDISGEEQIYVRDVDGRDALQITRCAPSRLDSLVWAPDGKNIGYADHRASFYIVEVETGATREAFFDENLGDSPFVSASWSPDGQWLVSSLGNPNLFRSIHLYSLRDGKTHRVTDDSAQATCPQFDPEGRYLYWISEVQKINVYDSFLGDHVLINPSIVVAATLRNDMPSPLCGGQDGRTEEDGKREVSKFRIDVDGLGKRITALPIGSSTYTSLRALKGRLIYLSEPDQGESSLKIFDLAEKKEHVLIKGGRYGVPAGYADTVAYRAGSTIGLVDIKPDQKVGDGPVDLSSLNMTIDPRKEWRQIFNEAWRIQRDFFFDEDLHGIDWAAMKRKYEALLPFVATRQDLNDLIEDMFAELGQSHVEISGGDVPEIPRKNSGLLGIDLELDGGSRLYKIAKIYRGQNWDPERISPLTLPGMNIKEGDFLFAIDGTALKEGLNPDSLLENKAGATVVLTVSSAPSWEGARQVKVIPTSFSESEGDFLRYNEWVLGNMEKVAAATEGKVGYIHIPDTYLHGIESFFRYYYSQARKQALIIDIRFNSGGYPPHWMIELLNRKFEQYRRLPHGKALSREPEPGFFGPKVCLVNEWAKSGGDMFADTFRLWNCGSIIGKRTSGNLASTGGFRLVDGTVVVYPATGPQNENGENIIENIGISPDIDVANRPDDVIRGRDPQLEHGIREIMRRLIAPDFPSLTSLRGRR